MRPGKIKRFSAWQIVLHWAQAVPYLLLICSGALMLGQRLLEIEFVPHEKLATVHRGAGLALISLLLVIFAVSSLSGRFSHIGRDIAHCFLWRREDLLWLLKVLFNSVLPRVRLPAVGRFNAGQKLHGAFIFLAVPVFALSGLSMIYTPGGLGPWVVHVTLFLIAAGFLALHLFLALINLPTSQALGGIFTGYVSRRYADSHHPLWRHAKGSHDHGYVLSWKALLAVLFCGALLAAAGVWIYGPERLGKRLARWGQAQAIEIINPGSLAASHADDPRIDGCLSCHRWFEATADSACLSCHTEIEEVLAKDRGYHGRLGQACASCHADHEGYGADIRHLDSKGFDHQQARFNLKGKHAVLPCSDCHLLKKQGTHAQQQRYIGVKFESCLVCHANPHGNSKADDCNRCHDEQGWKEQTLLFVHNRDCEFEIDAIHSVLACASCHEGQGFPLYQSLPKTCQDCHPEAVEALAGQILERRPKPDPHAGRVACIKCHLPQTANPSPQQYAQTCRDCHNEHYERLFFDWSKSLQNRQAEGQRILDALSAGMSVDAEQLKEIADQAKRLGLHNVQLARQLWEQVLSRDHQKNKSKQ